MCVLVQWVCAAAVLVVVVVLQLCFVLSWQGWTYVQKHVDRS
jgi:predicted negative regulator of RcsB-dependent stress response